MAAWSDQVALVTGGARGIGRATALLLAKRGAAVWVNYSASANAAEELVAEITVARGRATEAVADVAMSAAVEATVARTEKELTILVNNAGVSWRGTLDTYDPEQVARMAGQRRGSNSFSRPLCSSRRRKARLLNGARQAPFLLYIQSAFRIVVQVWGTSDCAAKTRAIHCS